MKAFFTKLLRSKYSLLFLILFIALLYVLQEKAITPLVMKVVQSDLFFEPEQEEEALGPVKNQRTGFALIFCKDAAKEAGELPDLAEFRDEHYQAWALGNRHYVIRSTVRLIDPERGQVDQLYACKMRMTGDHEAEAASWTVLGVDFNPAAAGD